MAPKFDLSGQTFGRLTVKGLSEKRDKTGNVFWDCECSCGATAVVLGNSLRRRATLSCGCYQKDRTRASVALRTKHGMSKLPEYAAWRSMLHRCYNPAHADFRGYGSRGITVCDAWLDNPQQFYADMGPRPSPQHSIDRYPNNDGNYEPSNCRWATPKEQANNRRPARVAAQ
jgi:hypothetical protein